MRPEYKGIHIGDLVWTEDDAQCEYLMHQLLSRLVILRLYGLNRKVLVVFESLSRIGALHIDALKNLVVARGVLPPDAQLVN